MKTIKETCNKIIEVALKRLKNGEDYGIVRADTRQKIDNSLLDNMDKEFVKITLRYEMLNY